MPLQSQKARAASFGGRVRVLPLRFWLAQTIIPVDHAESNTVQPMDALADVILKDRGESRLEEEDGAVSRASFCCGASGGTREGLLVIWEERGAV